MMKPLDPKALDLQGKVGIAVVRDNHGDAVLVELAKPQAVHMIDQNKLARGATIRGSTHRPVLSVPPDDSDPPPEAA